MVILTEKAVLICKHATGLVENKPSQDWVTIESARVLVENDPEGRSIKGCTVVPPMGRPCVTTLVVQAGYSEWIRVDGKRICLDTVTGFTDGTPPGVAKYKVSFAGQEFVTEENR
jgi:hypothetical protein